MLVFLTQLNEAIARVDGFTSEILGKDLEPIQYNDAVGDEQL